VPRRALVVTVVHHPSDARIRHREIAALLDAGWQVTYAAPFSSHGVAVPAAPARLSAVDLPRASGRRRLGAFRAARELLRTGAAHHDVVLLHDAELLLTLLGLELPPVVWDVHEDTPAAMTLKPWLPSVLRGSASAAVDMLERIAARRVHVILAEESYRDRFGLDHVVVPNTVSVPDRITPPSDRKVVYLGHVTLARGAAELVSVGRQLAQADRDSPRLLVIGAADLPARRLLEPAAEAGYLDWAGFVPSDRALGMLSGALAGLSLLHDEPNYRGSMPTKVVEYMAYGVPVITTPLPIARDLVDRANCGVVVPYGDPDAVVQEINRLRADPAARTRMGRAGHQVARAAFDWRRIAGRFVDEIERIAGLGGKPTPGRADASGAK
jgi:glycosyltransferase involved in cell wall biosynthesis